MDDPAQNHLTYKKLIYVFLAFNAVLIVAQIIVYMINMIYIFILFDSIFVTIFIYYTLCHKNKEKSKDDEKKELQKVVSIMNVYHGKMFLMIILLLSVLLIINGNDFDYMRKISFGLTVILTANLYFTSYFTYYFSGDEIEREINSINNQVNQESGGVSQLRQTSGEQIQTNYDINISEKPQIGYQTAKKFEDENQTDNLRDNRTSTNEKKSKIKENVKKKCSNLCSSDLPAAPKMRVAVCISQIVLCGLTIFGVIFVESSLKYFILIILSLTILVSIIIVVVITKKRTLLGHRYLGMLLHFLCVLNIFSWLLSLMDYSKGIRFFGFFLIFNFLLVYSFDSAELLIDVQRKILVIGILGHPPKYRNSYKANEEDYYYYY